MKKSIQVIDKQYYSKLNVQSLILSVSFLAFLFHAVAEEGMLIPSVISAFESDMKAKGMKLSADDIYSVNHSSLKDAVFQFGGGCTAEVVSDKGLLLTNHHCGYSAVQSHSSLENDYLKYGFWAKNYGEELPNPGLTATRIVRIEDVTKTMFFGIADSDPADKKMSFMQRNMTQLIKDATTGTLYEAQVKAFNFGNDYYLIVKEVFKDVRLVGTPPNSIGKFGGDTDNWVWPRHTGDFSVFRIYAGAGNQPAVYSTTNVPYEPIHFLPISFKSRKTGDFTMVYGFPGETEQHVVSGYLKFIMEKERPMQIRMREKSLSIIDAAMRESDEVRIKYSAKQASIANAYKKWIGQVDGLKRMDAISVKQQQEKQYVETAKTNGEWNQRYAPLIDQMNKLTTDLSNAEFKLNLYYEYLSVGPEYYKLARNLNDFVQHFNEYVAKNQVDSMVQRYKSGADGFFKNYDAHVDRKIFELLTDEFLKQCNNLEYNALVGDVKVKAALIYAKSIFTSKERYVAFWDKFKGEKSLKKLKKDAGFELYTTLNSDFREKIIPEYQVVDQQMEALLKVYVEGKYVMFPNNKHWADANSTLRITYGQLEGSKPADGMMYTEHTTIDGIIAKYNTGNPDFDLLPRMLELYEKKDYGEYAQDGELWVCFTGSNHTTGGNSGSPCIDENGNLMGLNFDRTWESTMSDYMFDTSRCRNIVVDIRYVLWVMDKYAGAKHLVDEMVLKRD